MAPEKKSYYLGVYWGRWHLKNGDLVSEKNWDFCPTVWTYIGEDCAQRIGIWFQKKCQAFLSYNLGVYWGRWRPKNGHLVSGQFSGTCCPTVWADKATNGTPKMDVLWQDIFQGLLSHSLDTWFQKWFSKKGLTKWEEQLSTFLRTENLNLFSVFNTLRKLLSCSADSAKDGTRKN